MRSLGGEARNLALGGSGPRSRATRGTPRGARCMGPARMPAPLETRPGADGGTPLGTRLKMPRWGAARRARRRLTRTRLARRGRTVRLAAPHPLGLFAGPWAHSDPKLGAHPRRENARSMPNFSNIERTAKQIAMRLSAAAKCARTRQPLAVQRADSGARVPTKRCRRARMLLRRRRARATTNFWPSGAGRGRRRSGTRRSMR